MKYTMCSRCDNYCRDIDECNLLVCESPVATDLEDAFEALQEHIKSGMGMTRTERVKAQSLLDELIVLCYGERKSF